MDVLFSGLTLALMVLGLIGSAVPIVPGPFLIWLGAVAWAWKDGFQAVGWPTLVFLGLLTVLAWGSDLLVTAVLGRKTGVSWKAIAGAVVGAIAGGLLLGGFVPVVGTLLAALAGGVAGILLVEYADKRNWRLAMQAGRTYILGYLLSSLIEVWLAGLMIVLFVWQAFL